MSHYPDCCLLQYVCTSYIIFRLTTAVRLYILHHIPFRQQQYVITTMFDDLLEDYNVFVSLFFWCPCMAINNVSVQYNGELLPDIILLTQCYYHQQYYGEIKNEVFFKERVFL